MAHQSVATSADAGVSNDAGGESDTLEVRKVTLHSSYSVKVKVSKVFILKSVVLAPQKNPNAKRRRRCVFPVRTGTAHPKSPPSHLGSASGGSKPCTQGKNLSPGFRGWQHCEKSGALSLPSIMQNGVRW